MPENSLLAGAIIAWIVATVFQSLNFRELTKKTKKENYYKNKKHLIDINKEMQNTIPSNICRNYVLL